MASKSYIRYYSGFFVQGGGQVHVRICVQNVWQTWGVQGHVPSGNFDFIRRNLVESGTVFAQTQFTIYCYESSYKGLNE